MFHNFLLFLLLSGIPAYVFTQPLDSLRFHQRYDSIETLNNAGLYQEAFQLSQKLYEQTLSDLGTNSSFTAYACLSLGVAYIKNSQFDQAEPLLKQCIEIRKALFGMDYVELTVPYNAMGVICSDSGQPHKAIPYYEEALRILKIHFPPGDSNYGQTCNNLGIAYELLGEMDKALEMYQQSLAAKMNNIKTPILQISNTYNNIGAVYQNTGDLEKAIENYQYSLGLLEQHELQNTQEYALGLMNLGVVWFMAKNNFLSKKFLDAAKERADIVFGKTHLSKASLLLNLGINYIEMGELVTARSLINDAQSIFRSNFGEGSYFDMPCFIALGHLLLKEGRADSSLVLFNNALDISVNNFGESHTQTILALNNIGVAYDKMGDFGKSIDIYRRAIINYEKKFIDIEQPVVPALDYFDACVNLTSVLLGEFVKSNQNHLPDEIQTLLEKCFFILEKMQEMVSDQITRQALAANSLSLMEIAIKAATYEDNRQAFEFTERAKAGNLLITILEQNTPRFSGLPPEKLNEELHLKNQVAFFEKYIAESVDNFDFAAVSESRQQLDSLKLRLDSIKTELKNINPDYYDLKYNLSTITIPQVQQQLLQPGEALLEYFIGDSLIYIFVITPTDFHLEEVKKDFPLQTWIDTLRHNIYQNVSTGSAAYVQAAADLYDKLLRPVQNRLPEHLIIIPDGVLGYIPFESLLTERPKDPKRFDKHAFMLLKYQISYCYSATLLAKMKERKHRQPPALDLLAFAPHYTGNPADLKVTLPLVLSNEPAPSTSRSAFEEMDELPYSGIEVRSIREITSEGDIFYGKEATEERFVEMAGRYRILHLATHARADNRVGDYSFLLFYFTDDSTENEVLYVRDLYDLELNADLVVLSACETGLGQLQKGEGIISLARAFAYAGAKSIVSTLWQVNDERTKDLMVTFYDLLKKGKPKDEALRSAKLAFIQGNASRAHPFYWAGLIPVGDMQAVW